MHTHWSQFVPNNYVNPTSEDIKLHIIIMDRHSAYQQSEQGGGAWLSQWAGQCFAVMQVSTWAGSPDFVFVTVFRTAVQRASYGVHKLLRTGEVFTTLTSIFLVLADGLFGLCRSERLGQVVHRYHPHPLPPISPVPNRRYLVPAIQFIHWKTRWRDKTWDINNLVPISLVSSTHLRHSNSKIGFSKRWIYRHKFSSNYHDMIDC